MSTIPPSARTPSVRTPFTRRLVALLVLPLALGGCDGDEPADDLDQEPAAMTADEPGEDQDDVRPVGRYLETASHPVLGSYLTNQEGQVLYMFTADSLGQSTCYDACAQAWPAYVTDDERIVAEEPVDEGLADVIQREDGRWQVTYAGWPLYYYGEGPSQEPVGQGIESYGGTWWVVSPEGEIISEELQEMR